MFTICRAFALILVLMAFAGCAGHKDKKTTQHTNGPHKLAPPKIESASEPTKLDLLKTIEIGRDFASKKKFDACTVDIRKKGVACGVRVYLVIVHKESGGLRVVGLDENGNAIDDDVKVENDLTYSLPLHLGPGDAYKVTEPKGYIVVAAKRRNGVTQSGMVYTPYSAALDTPEVREAGARLLQSSVETAMAQLRKEGITSVAFRKKLVADVSLPELVMILPIIEQFRHSLLKTEGVETLLAQNFTVFGTNGESAYRTVHSGAGARGAFQIMPGTYRLITNRYDDADLGKSYVACASNLVCAAKCAILLNDSDLAMVPKHLRPALLTDAQALARYLAAAYNTGGPRAVSTLKEYGGKDGWNEHIPKREAQDYVMKLNAIWPEVFQDHEVKVATQQ